MSHYADPRINTALGIEPNAEMDDTLAAIAQLRASAIDAGRLRDELAETRTEWRAADVETERVRAERDEARKTANANRERCDELRAELKAANENANAGAERDAIAYQTLRNELDRAQADNAALRQRVGSLDRNLTEAESGRDAAFAALHYATGGFL